MIASAPKHGYVTLNAYGGFTYTPIAGYIGPDQFTYYSWDFFTGSAQAQTVKLAVGGDGGPMNEDLVVMLDVDAEDLEVAQTVAPLQPVSTTPPRRIAVAPPTAPSRPQRPVQSGLQAFLQSVGSDLSSIASVLLSPVESFNAQYARSIAI